MAAGGAPADNSHVQPDIWMAVPKGLNHAPLCLAYARELGCTAARNDRYLHREQSCDMKRVGRRVRVTILAE